ncbi:hypothetical protein B296_00052098 [Ensete ventricosum]|uniref:Uncharacterized protein n=1 Tax=Ensete ventricosum TaxID=4639 RepID=A0A426XQ15_ENSVE|nr:hypothetical protein B296_00052098 [Ensete ventricosum]
MGSRMSMVSQKKFRSWEVVRARFRKKILATPNVLAHGKSYEHAFAKKPDGHQHCTKLSFDQFFVYRLKISKYWLFPTY